LAESLTAEGSHIYISDDLVVSAVNAIGGNAGTWGHPLVAIEVARWISPQFGVWCNLHIKVLIETGSTSLNKPLPGDLPKLPPTPETVMGYCSIIDYLCAGLTVDPNIVSQLKVNLIQRHLPEIAEEMEGVREALIFSTATEHRLLIPTQIGQELGISGQAVNKLLIEKGLQEKNKSKRSKKEPSYVPTSLGEEHSTFTLASGKKEDNTTFQQLKWYDSVLSLIS
jgi:hypothetical protein